MMMNDFQQLDIYNGNDILSQCKDVVLEAKRVILSEDLNKIANTLSQVNNTKTENGYPKVCKRTLDWKDQAFWTAIPNPKNNSINKIAPVISKKEPQLSVISDLLQYSIEKLHKTKENPDSNVQEYDQYAKKYFNRWRAYVKLNREKRNHLEENIRKQEKLDCFIDKLKTCRKFKIKNTEDNGTGDFISNTKPISSYQNRFKAQKYIIDMQKAKLEEQNKIIAELELGIIREDIMKSIENTRVNIREIFSNCSHKLKLKMPLVSDVPKFELNTQKAPKFVQQVEERAMARARNRQIILERKHLIEQARQKMLEEAIERKRVIEEEDRRRNLEMIKERRKKELQIEKTRQANNRIYQEKISKALNFHRKLFLKQCFLKLYHNLSERDKKRLLSIKHYETKTLRKSLKIWMNYVDTLYKPKYEIADAFSTERILKKYFKIWKYEHMEIYRNMQVAEDYHEFRLISNIFIHWHRYVCIEIIRVDKIIKIAKKHYERSIIFHYFYQWRSLKAVLELEKTKELKKRKWREKVWEILPDYKPPDESFF